MQKKYLGYVIVGGISLALILMLSLNVMAAGNQVPFTTDKSDRTILKEILVNQGRTQAMLKEIKVLLQEKK
jgi:hypothetical protein